MSIQVVTNAKGKKTAVIVPIADWEEIQKRLNTEQFFDEFNTSMQAIKEDINGNTKLKNARSLTHGHRG
ncbi:hypothetical protein [Mucilaginibacter sp.]|uniref:hypothetical protein n=1 Tax=Mucilaginibacter sp. TaxID=1882438 RepID=UPI00260D980C|nr:hypothetical protein [Mucilaginibacter sp.]MDB4921374.1 hypothetical protein [Mucilaginibacter sp.]